MNWGGRQFSELRRTLRWSVVLTLGMLVLLSVGSSPPDPVKGEPDPELGPIVEGNTTFSLELFSRLNDQDRNLIVSPFSISSALAMAYGGARGNTEKQMAQALHFPGSQVSFHPGMGALLAALTNLATRGEVDLQIANGLWPQRDYQFTSGFSALCRRNYGAGVDVLDFKTSAEFARKRINSWIQSHTKGIIGDLFAPGAVTPATRLVIANAVYFKGNWASRFDKKNTSATAFWSSPAKAVQVPMMRQKSVFLYLAEGDLQVLEMPYHGGGISMLVLLPKARDGLRGLEQELTSERLNHWIEKLESANVDLLFPKFKMSSRLLLNQTLGGMGMADAFDEARADFTGMTPQRPLFLDVANHAALVEVDEEGTAAAAATGISLGCAKEPRPATLHADHPFLFMIRDRRTGTLLFVGRVAHPDA